MQESMDKNYLESILIGLFDGDGYRRSDKKLVYIASSSYTNLWKIKELFIQIFGYKPRPHIYVESKYPYRITVQAYVLSDKVYHFFDQDNLDTVADKNPLGYLLGFFYSDGNVDVKLDRRYKKYYLVYYGLKLTLYTGRRRKSDPVKNEKILIRIKRALDTIGMHYNMRILKPRNYSKGYIFVLKTERLNERIVLDYPINYKYFIYKFCHSEISFNEFLLALYIDYWLLNRLIYRIFLPKDFYLRGSQYNSIYEDLLLKHILSITNTDLNEIAKLTKEDFWMLWSLLRIYTVDDILKITKEIMEEIKLETITKDLIEVFPKTRKKLYLDLLKLLEKERFIDIRYYGIRK